ncbi:MAG: hypothetical protein WD512_17240 [Candidatus Paceibacterota bacterium]
MFIQIVLITSVKSQEKITSLNFLQAGAVPNTINERGKNISTSGLTFNYVRFTEDKFYRMDATWLMRYIVNGQKDTAVFNDTNKVFGLDLPVFTATYGINLIKGEDFSLGIGINLDSRTFFSSPSAKAKNIIDAFNTGIAVGLKIKLKPWLSYYSITGYDLMFTDAVGSFANGNQFYIQNNFSFLLGGKFGINLQPDFTFKSFDTNGIQGGQIFNKNIKLGLVYAIQ